MTSDFEQSIFDIIENPKNQNNYYHVQTACKDCLINHIIQQKSSSDTSI